MDNTGRQRKTAKTQFTRRQSKEPNMTTDFYAGNSTTRGIFAAGIQRESLIDFDGDQDWFKTYLVADTEYVLYLRSLGNGADEIDPVLRLLNENSELLFTDDNSGTGNNARITFTVPKTGNYFVDVGSVSGLGAYRLSLRSKDDDFKANGNTQGRIRLTNLFGSVNGTLNQVNDADWFRIQLKADEWYTVRISSQTSNPHQQGPPSVMIRDLKSGTRTGLESTQRFLAERDGTYFVVARAFGNFGDGKPVDYEVSVRAGTRPFISTTAPQTGSTSLNIGAVIDDNDFPIRYYHILSDEDLTFGYNFNVRTMPAGQVYRAAAGFPLNRWRTEKTDKPHNVYVRGMTSKEGENLTPWVKINVNNHDSFPILSQARHHNGTVTFAFAEDMPSYFENDASFPTFEKLADHERNSVREALRRWQVFQNAIEFEEIAPNAQNDNATVMIFKSDIGDPVQGFYPGPAGGGDLVLNSSNLGSLKLGESGFFELIRGIGSTMGFKADNNYSRNESVLGRKTDADTFNGIYPTTPGTHDVSAIKFKYGINRNIRRGDNTYRFVAGEAPTYADFGGTDAIDGTGTAKTQIDLAPGAMSYQLDGNFKSAIINLGYDSQIENAIGGSNNDMIWGNGWNNHIYGGAGLDTIEGRAGDDFLFGGAQGDTYVYRFADGHDVINEEDQGGRDRLRIEGMLSFDSFPGDLAFRKSADGKDLIINLMFDRNDTVSQGSIRIKNMNSRRSQIETLIASSATNPFGEASLRSIFGAATTDYQRFELTTERDAFGFLAVPV